MQFIDISIEGVDQFLQGLSPNKASGPDEISPKILKELHHEIAPILTLIFNLSLETGVVPILHRLERTADVVPVYKKGSKSNGVFGTHWASGSNQWPSGSFDLRVFGCFYH